MHVGLHVLDELRRSEHRVATVGRDQRVRHRADPAAAPPGGLRLRGDADLGADDLAGHVGGVAVAGLDAVVVVAGRHEDDRLAVRGLQHAHDVAGDQRPPREHAEVDGLEMGEARVVALDPQHGLVRVDRVAVVERVHGQVVPVVGAELQHRDRLVDPAEVRVPLLEDLHHHARAAVVADQDLARVVEVRVGVVALPHLLDRELEDLGRKPLTALSGYVGGSTGHFRRTPGLSPRVLRSAPQAAPQCEPAAACSSSRHAASAARRPRAARGVGSAVASRCCSSWPGHASARAERLVGVAHHPAEDLGRGGDRADLGGRARRAAQVRRRLGRQRRADRRARDERPEQVRAAALVLARRAARRARRCRSRCARRRGRPRAPSCAARARPARARAARRGARRQAG